MRLDLFLVKKEYFDSRTKAKQAIERGEIFINGKVVLKSSFEINVDNDFTVERIFNQSFVSLGGYKLQKALNDFNYSVDGLVCADIGASTGGFTDCLLQNGADKVFAVDLNDNLLHNTLKTNQKVVSIIKNVKELNLNDFSEKLDLIVADLSFISITYALPIISKLIEDGKVLIILIKPQFETDEKIKFKNGVIRDKKLQHNACLKAYNCAVCNNLTPINFTSAPKNEDKNLEFLMMFEKNGDKLMDKNQIKI